MNKDHPWVKEVVQNVKDSTKGDKDKAEQAIKVWDMDAETEDAVRSGLGLKKNGEADKPQE